MVEKAKTWVDIVGQVPAKLVTWAFIVLTGILSIFSGIAIFAWMTNETLVLAGYEFGRASVGSGAVVAYDLDECPSGWSAYKPATGRSLVGAGSSYDPAYKQDDNGDLKPYVRLSFGGARQHKLLVEELPTHSHELAFISIDAEKLQMSKGDAATNIPYFNRQGHPQETLTSVNNGVIPSGGSKEHNNMPPYIALFFCKKG